MAVKVIIPVPLRPYAGKNESVLLEGSTVDEVMQNLTARYTDLQKHLYAESGKLRSFVNIYKNDEDIRHLRQGSTPVQENDVLTIVPSIAGGGNIRAATARERGRRASGPPARPVATARSLCRGFCKHPSRDRKGAEAAGLSVRARLQSCRQGGKIGAASAAAVRSFE